MPHFAIVIDNPEKAHAARRQQMADAYAKARPAATQAKATAFAEEREPHPPKKGDLWTTADVECPDGLPNCRNCGDPAHAASCQAKGHCPHCGTRHGIAPASVLKAKGLVLVEVGQPRDDQIWDASARGFMTR